MKHAFTERWTDRFSSVYADNKLSDVPWFTAAPSFKVMEAVINGLIPRGCDVVDMGCGPGLTAVFLAAAGAHVTGIDISSDALAKAQALADWAGVHVNLVQTSILETGLSSASADVVNDSFTFHNVKDEMLDSYAAEIHRILRPGGLFLLSSFSDRMIKGSGPRRITGEEIFSTFRREQYECRHLEIHRNLPTEARPSQNHWFGIFRAISANDARER